VAEAAIQKLGRFLIPDGVPKSEIRPTRIERRARLVSAIARGRRCLTRSFGRCDRRSADRNTSKCSVRQVNMTISLAFSHQISSPAVEVVCRAVLESSDFVMLRQNGADSSKPLD